MPQIKSHEFLHLQEHIRAEAAAAQTFRQLAGQCQDPELKQFVESQAQAAESTVQQLMGFIQG